MPRSLLVALAMVLMAAGCAGSLSESRLASAGEVMCKHCNCLMPAGIDPATICPVCKCGLVARQCVRGR